MSDASPPGRRQWADATALDLWADGFSLSANPPANPPVAAFRQGDWVCASPGCSFHNFGRNERCMACGSQKPTPFGAPGAPHQHHHHRFHSNPSPRTLSSLPALGSHPFGGSAPPGPGVQVASGGPIDDPSSSVFRPDPGPQAPGASQQQQQQQQSGQQQQQSSQQGQHKTGQQAPFCLPASLVGANGATTIPATSPALLAALQLGQLGVGFGVNGINPSVTAAAAAGASGGAPPPSAPGNAAVGPRQGGTGGAMPPIPGQGQIQPGAGPASTVVAGASAGAGGGAPGANNPPIVNTGNSGPMCIQPGDWFCQCGFVGNDIGLGIANGAALAAQLAAGADPATIQAAAAAAAAASKGGKSKYFNNANPPPNPATTGPAGVGANGLGLTTTAAAAGESSSSFNAAGPFATSLPTTTRHIPPTVLGNGPPSSQPPGSQRPPISVPAGAGGYSLVSGFGPKGPQPWQPTGLQQQQQQPSSSLPREPTSAAQLRDIWSSSSPYSASLPLGSGGGHIPSGVFGNGPPSSQTPGSQPLPPPLRPPGGGGVGGGVAVNGMLNGLPPISPSSTLGGLKTSQPWQPQVPSQAQQAQQAQQQQQQQQQQLQLRDIWSSSPARPSLSPSHSADSVSSDEEASPIHRGSRLPTPIGPPTKNLRGSPPSGGPGGTSPGSGGGGGGGGGDAGEGAQAHQGIFKPQPPETHADEGRTSGEYEFGLGLRLGGEAGTLGLSAW